MLQAQQQQQAQLLQQQTTDGSERKQRPKPIVVVPPTPKAKQKHKQPLFKIFPKYLENGAVPSAPYLTNQVTEHLWLKKPFYSFRELGVPALPGRYHWHPIDKPHFKGRYYSLTNDLAIQRMTFVFPGRMQAARAPCEENDGRVVLVVPNKDAKEALGWLDANTDLLVIDSISIASGSIESVDLGLISTRRLAALYLAQEWELEDFMMLDDNIERFYLGLEGPGTWSDIYNYMKQSATAKTHKSFDDAGLRPQERH